MKHEVITNGIDFENLTKEEAVYLHRMMWYGIARKIRRNRHTVKIIREKEAFCNTYCNGALILSKCFCCEYGFQRTRQELVCVHCPLLWEVDNKRDYFMCESVYNYASNWLRCCMCGNWKEQAKIAQTIASLPVNMEV